MPPHYSHDDDDTYTPDVQLILLGGAALAALLLLVALAILAVRSCNARPGAERRGDQVAHASDYETLTVHVHAHGYESELDVSTDAFETYEEVSA